MKKGRTPPPAGSATSHKESNTRACGRQLERFLPWLPGWVRCRLFGWLPLALQDVLWRELGARIAAEREEELDDK